MFRTTVLTLLLLTLAIISCGSKKFDIKKVAETEAERLQNETDARRRLSAQVDLVTGETLTTFDGDIPEVSCPAGFWRPLGSTNLVRVSGQRTDGCRPCPRGRYGSTSGLTDDTCTASCPAGRYGPQYAATSIDECVFCPIGRYGVMAGMVSEECSGTCPAGKYSSVAGLTSATGCITCPRGYRGGQGQCQWAVQPRAGQDQDHQHNEVFGLPENFEDPLND
jgi:hypothetical protein